MSIVVSVENLSKRYRLGSIGGATLRDELRRWGARRRGAPNPLAQIGHSPDAEGDQEHWALRDVSFQVRDGEILGILGRNGAGKSTLLKILSAITAPTVGEVRLRGRIASLLEVGTGFHPELTGRENVFLNGAILGMTKAEIGRKFDEIIEFSGVTGFIDMPVKRYSSGMALRLAFAVAAHLDSEILVIDEVLAVGDAEFQKKCIGKMGEVARSGRTVLFVSHMMDAVQRLCTRCIRLDNGRAVDEGEPAHVVGRYLSEKHVPATAHYRETCETANGTDAQLLAADVLDASGTPCDYLRFSEPFSIRLEWRHNSPFSGASYALRVYDRETRLLFATNTLGYELGMDRVGVHRVTCRFDTNILPPGEYEVTIGCYIRPHTVVAEFPSCLRLQVENVVTQYGPKLFDIVGNPAVVLPSRWDSEPAPDVSDNFPHLVGPT